MQNQRAALSKMRLVSGVTAVPVETEMPDPVLGGAALAGALAIPMATRRVTAAAERARVRFMLPLDHFGLAWG